MIERLVFRDGEHGKEDSEHTSDAWEDLDPVGEVRAEAGGVGWVKCGTGQGVD